MSLTLGVDVGGTKIAAGVVAPDGRILEELRRVSPATDAEALNDAIVEVTQQLTARHRVTAVGISAAGFVDASCSTVMFAPNLAWRDEPLSAAIGRRVGLPVVVENDANAAAWGEFQFGAGADVDDLLLVAVGTGIGGGVVIEGTLLRGSFGVAAEIGHLRLVPDGLPCGCGRRGCWEQYASGRALVRSAREAVAVGRRFTLVPDLHEQVLDGPSVTRAAQRGDPLAVELLVGLGHRLGEGIASLAAVLDPGVVVIGGGVAEAADLVMRPVQDAFEEHLPAGEHRPHLELRVATLGNDAAVVGAADLARRNG